MRGNCEKVSIASHRLLASASLAAWHQLLCRSNFSPDSRPLAAPVLQLQDGGGDGQVQGQEGFG